MAVSQTVVFGSLASELSQNVKMFRTHSRSSDSDFQEVDSRDLIFSFPKTGSCSVAHAVVHWHNVSPQP